MAVSEQEFARIRNIVLRGGGAGGISSVNLVVSGSETATGGTFYLTGANGLIITANDQEKSITFAAGGISEVAISSDAYTNISGTYTVAGGASFDATLFANKNLFFRVAGYVDSGCSMDVVLYNLTDDTEVELINVTETVPTTSLSASISLTDEKFYETRIRRSGGNISKNVYLLNSSIKVV
jgi:hypothetical protein